MPSPVLAEPLTVLAGIRHGFFTRQGGVSDGIYDSLNCGIGSNDLPERVRENRGRVAETLRVSADALVSPYQVHGTSAVAVTRPFSVADRPKADALVTDRPGIALAVGTADCGPVLFADAHAGVIGAAHSGWKGAFEGILESTVAAMQALGAEPGRIVAVLGPTISAAAYEVGPEFVARFEASDPGHACFFSPSARPGHAMFDLPAFITMRLSRLGLARVADLSLCTYADAVRFFSYRRATHRGEPDYGRLVAAIALAG